MLVTNKYLLDRANKKRYGVGAFNVNNMEFIQAVIKAAEIEESPAIIQTSEGAIKYAGIELLSNMIKTAAKKTKIPVSLHLDHGRDMSVIKACLKNGYTSIMFDGSNLDFNNNIKITKKVVAMAHKVGASVEAEIGTIGGAEDNVSSREIILSEPQDALRFAKETKVDSLAIAIGTSHGAYKFAGKSKLDFKRLKEIKKIVKTPLVLHGASGIPADVVKKANRFGAKIKNAHGVSDSNIRDAVKYGINKVNIDSDLRLTFDGNLREFLKKNPTQFDPRKILGYSRDAIIKIIRHKMQILKSSRKA